MRKFLMLRFLLFALVMAVVAISCKDDSPAPTSAVPSFQFAVDADVFNKVQFTNFSQNAVSVSWNFGDGSAASTEENPVHTYATEGKYTVVLTAIGADKVAKEKSLEVPISDPNKELKKLTGETSKTWKLLRDVSGGIYPMEVGPQAGGAPYWAFGLTQGAMLGDRPCALNDEFIFYLDGKYTYDAKGDVFADGGLYGPWSDGINSACVDATNDNFKGKNNIDISAWNSGDHTFTYVPSTKKLTVIGLGAFIALQKVGTTAEISVPQESVAYNVLKLVDDVVDTLVIEALQGTANYWKFVLVHYDNPSLEPPIPGAKPNASFTAEVNGKGVTFTNTSTNSASYSWNFDDNTTSTSESPVHTYASNGTYFVTLTATNGDNTSVAKKAIIIGGTACTTDGDESLTPATGLDFTLQTTAFGSFGNIVSQKTDNPSVDSSNPSCSVNEYTKTTGCETWSGVAYNISVPLDFTTATKKKFKLKVYAVDQMTTVTLRLEKNPYPDTEPSQERTADITATRQWQELTFDFSDVNTGTISNIIVYFEKGEACDGDSYYFDDLIQVQ